MGRGWAQEVSGGLKQGRKQWRQTQSLSQAAGEPGAEGSLACSCRKGPPSGRASRCRPVWLSHSNPRNALWAVEPFCLEKN